MTSPKPFKLKPQVIPEKVIETQILRFLWAKQIFAWKVQTIGVWDEAKKIYRKSHNPFHIKGVSDIQGVLPDGRALAIEVKSATGRPSEEQLSFIAKFNRNKGKAFIARSVDEVENELKGEGYIR